MSFQPPFPSLSGFEPTRQTLQLYSRAISAVPRAHVAFHPRWWHISLRVLPDGLITGGIPLPGGGSCSLKMDLVVHKILLVVNGDVTREFDMTAGTTAFAMGDAILGAVDDLGLTEERATGSYAREKFDNNEPRAYDPHAVPAFLATLVNADRIFKAHRATLSGEVGPVQLWTHGFDLAFEWFGTRKVTYEEGGEVSESPAQLNLGFYPGDPSNPPYFYSNPWPFEGEQLLNEPLPEGASWHTEGWQGTILPYAELEGDPDAEDRLRTYARAVFELVSPTLMA